MSPFWKFVCFCLIIAAIGAVLKVIAIAVIVVAGVIAAFYALILLLKVIGWIFGPFETAPKTNHCSPEQVAERERAYAEATRAQNERDAERERAKEELAEADRKKAAEQAQREAYRDSEIQIAPYSYQIGQHANEALAIRYGIANQERKSKEYWHFGRGGVKTRNPDRDTFYFEPSKTIRLQKTSKLSPDHYEVLLSDFRNRRARAVIEVGTEYVKTFYPLDDDWFIRNSHLETTLKGNGAFTLKELAEFHVLKAVVS